MELSSRQAKALGFISAYVDEHGYAPTVREVQFEVGHASVSSTHEMLKGLRDLGLIEWNQSSYRTLRVAT